jgi:TolB-like protein
MSSSYSSKIPGKPLVAIISSIETSNETQLKSFCDGIVQKTHHALSSIRELCVVTPVASRDEAQKRGAKYVVKVGANKERIIVELIEIPSDQSALSRHSETVVDEPFNKGNISGQQDSIAAKVVNIVKKQVLR